MADRAPVRSVPRMTSDAWRSCAAGLVGVVCGLLVAVLILRTTSLGFRAAQVVSAGWLMLFFFAAYTLLTWRTFGRLSGGRLNDRVRISNARRNARLERLLGLDSMSWMVSCVLVSLVVVVLTLLDDHLRTQAGALATAAALVVASWLAMLAAVAVLLMRADVDRTALRFPGGDEGHVFADYVYVAGQLLTTFASSDVEILTTRLRISVTVVSAIALVFNTVVVALLVSGVLTLAA